MRILLASSEVHPYSKTGGLADMVGALGKTLAKAGHQVWIVTPLYSGIRERLKGLMPAGLRLDLPMGGAFIRGEVLEWKAAPRLRICFVQQPEFFEREGLYQEQGVDFPDNSKRFIFFSKAVVEVARRLVEPPDIVHVHDWQTGLVPLMLRSERERAGWHKAPKSLLTIHNLAFQGVFPAVDFGLTNLSWDYFSTPYAEFYVQMNCLKAGIMSAEGLSTVSPRYAREILTAEYGCGLDGCLRARQAVLSGILNGVDYEEWNTTDNSFLKAPYSADDLAGKTVNKLELQKEAGLPVDESIPLFGSITRLTDQKGVDIALGALEEMLSARMQFVMMGNGDARWERALLDLASRYPQKCAVRIAFDQGFAHRVEAGCDFYLMPSRFEPCGLNQQYSLRYGTVAIVRATGGLDDAITDIRDDPELADGIKFHEYSPRALAKAIRKALVLFESKDLMHRYRHNGMSKNISWERAAGRYEALYGDVLGVEGPGSSKTSKT